MNESLGMRHVEKSFLNYEEPKTTFDFPNGTKYTVTFIKISYLHVVKHQLPTHCGPL